MIKDVSDLEVYEESLKLLPEIYNLTNKLPKSEYDLVLQAKRSGKSIASNISATLPTPKRCLGFFSGR